MTATQEIDNTHGHAWRPGVARYIPWPAFLCVTGFALCCIGLGLVLSESDNKEVATWPYASRTVSVSVLLSLLVSIANVCLAGALSKAYEVAWWIKAIRGAELHRLQFDLNVQQNTWTLVSRSFTIDQFAIVAVLALAISVVDGPLIQKASNIVTHIYAPVGGHVGVRVVNGNLPDDFSGFGAQFDILTPVFSNISHAYANRDPIALVVAACAANTTCTFDLPGPGFDISCNMSSSAYDFIQLAAGTNHDNITTFNVAVDYAADTTFNSLDQIKTSAMFKPDTACTGQLQTRTCSLRIGRVNYRVTVANGVATLGAWDPARNDTLSLLQSQSPFDVLYSGSFVTGNLYTMLGGIYSVVRALYASSANLQLATTDLVPYILTSTGQGASNYLTTENLDQYSNCTMTWSDPTSDLVNTVRELMLRSIITYANQSSSNSSQEQIMAQLTKTAPTYQSTYKYLAATLACMGAEMLLILFLLAGWRHLGRDVSLDPFEIARALGAPLLQAGSSSSSNSHIDTALQPIRHTKLRYGEILLSEGVLPSDGTAPASVSSADAAQTTSTKEGSCALVNGEDEPQQRPRLGLVHAHRAGHIRTGVLY